MEIFIGHNNECVQIFITMKCCKKYICLLLLMLIVVSYIIVSIFYQTSYIPHMFHVLRLFPLKWTEVENDSEHTESHC